MISPVEFVGQVKRELQRVTWPSQRETLGMALAVIIMIICAMIYFFAADYVIYNCLRKVLGV